MLQVFQAICHTGCQRRREADHQLALRDGEFLRQHDRLHQRAALQQLARGAYRFGRLVAIDRDALPLQAAQCGPAGVAVLAGGRAEHQVNPLDIRQDGHFPGHIGLLPGRDLDGLFRLAFQADSFAVQGNFHLQVLVGVIMYRRA